MRTVKKRSQVQEKSVAKTFNAKPTAASGALWGMKGDVRNSKYLIECKTTEKNFYPVTNKVWEKIQREAIKDHARTPLLVVDLQDKDRYVIFNPHDFDTELPLDRTDLVSNKITGSFRVYTWGKEVMRKCMLFGIKSTTGGVHNLALWNIDNFTEHFKEEL